GRCVSLIAEYLPLQDGGSTVFDKAFDAEDVLVEDTDPGEFDVEPYREVIDAVASRDDPVDVLVESVAPSHLGDRHIKEALICQLVRANAPTGADGKDYRGQIHMFLLGDPGAGKTDFGEALVRLAPRSQKSSGNEGTSAAGLTAAITRDDFSNAEFTVTAGAIPKCSGGALFLDELDSAGDQEQNALLEAMESGVINIEKAGQKATLEAETAILAAGNPENGHFDPERSPAEQTNVLSPLLDRFDLIFCPEEKTDPDAVEAIADHITAGRDAAQRREIDKNVPESADAVEPELSTEELRAYLAAAREKRPVFGSDEVRQTLRDWYVEVKTRIVRQEDEDGREYPVTPRAVGDIARLAEASAKARLSDEIEMVDVERATRLKGRSFAEFGLDPGVEVVAEDGDGDEGGLDFAGSTPTATISEIVDDLTLQGADYGAPREEVIARTVEVEDNLDGDSVSDLIEEMLAAETMEEVAEGRLITV
ncbi:ATP-binding protein, partial [Halorussus marinus]|uniref:ATP-binding protein n=1 Tax=Halorussus marinus TaxID=2505976 RepID=UPI00143DC777